MHPCKRREDREDFDLKAAEGNTGKRGRPDGVAPGPGGAGGKRVFVNNLAEETTWQALKDYFKQAGAVAHADVLTVCFCLLVQAWGLRLVFQACRKLAAVPVYGKGCS